MHWLNGWKGKRSRQYDAHERHPGVAKGLRAVAHRKWRRKMREKLAMTVRQRQEA